MKTQVARALLLASLAGMGASFLACGGSSSGGNDGGADGGGGGSSGSSSGAGTDGSSDEAICSTACTTLIGCGVGYDPSTCPTNCLQETVFIACVAGVGTDCNALALCAFKQGAATNCSSGEGIPSGAGSCDALRSCNGVCFSSSTPVACSCACQTALDPDKTLNALIDSECSQTKCATECSSNGSTAECGDCEAANCASQAEQCASN